MSSRLLESNLQALAARHPALAQRLRKELPSSAFSMSFVRARSGESVPVLHAGDRAYSLHSRFDPRREAERIAAEQEHTGYAVVLGIGGGYHLRALLKQHDLSRLLVVEPEEALLRELLAGVALGDVIDDPRVCILSGVSAAELSDFVRSDYTPFVDGLLRVLPLKPRVSLQRELFSAHAQAAADAARSQLSDYRAHAAYGRQWFRNTLLNLELLPGASYFPKKSYADAVVVAAGPSVEKQIERIRGRSTETVLIACDTALGLLSCMSLQPDIVVSIDSQNTTLLHFIGRAVVGTLTATLSAPTPLLRAAPHYSLLASGHPLERLIGDRLRLPYLDTGAGNVTHAACNIAEQLGVRRIELFGADYCYPYGVPYARGSYFYNVIARNQHRLRPTEASLYRFLYSRGELQMQKHAAYWAYESPLLSQYQASIGRAAATEIIRVAPDGTEHTLPADENHTAPRAAAGKACSTEEVAALRKELTERYAGLEIGHEPLWKQLYSLTDADRQTLFTLLPLATHLREHGSANVGDPSAALRSSLRYARQLLTTAG